MAAKRTEEGIRNYLDSLKMSDKRKVDREAVKALKAQIRDEDDPINKLKLLTQLEHEEAGRVPDFSGEKAFFVAEARAWAQDSDVTVGAFQQLGVPDEVLREAGFQVPAGRRSSSTARRTGGRSPAIPLDDVAAAARKLGSGWKLADLASVLDREPMTVRNYVTKLMERGVVVDLGEDPAHDGRGRAPKLYGMA